MAKPKYDDEYDDLEEETQAALDVGMRSDEAELWVQGPDNLILCHAPQPPRDFASEAALGRQEQIDREYGEVTGDDGGPQ